MATTALFKQNKVLVGSLFILIFWLSYVAMAISWIGGSILSNQVVGYFIGENASPVLAQMVNYTITFARAIANIVAAFLLLKLGPKKAVTLALAMVCVALLAPVSPNYVLYNIARMIMGLGGSMLMVYSNSVIANYLPQDKKVLASGIMAVSYNVAALSVAVLFLLFASYLYSHWQNALFLFGAVSVVSLVLWLAVGENFAVRNQLTSNTTEGYLSIIKEKVVWAYILAFSGFVFLFVFALTSLPVLMNNNFSANSAVIVVAVSLSGIIGVFTSIGISKLDIRRKSIFYFSGIIMMLSMGLAIYAAYQGLLNITYALIFISGFFMALQYPLLMAVVHEVKGYSIQRISIIVGYVWGFAYGIYTMLAIIWSFVYQFLGLSVALWFYIIVASVLYMFVVGLPETKLKTTKAILDNMV